MQEASSLDFMPRRLHMFAINGFTAFVAFVGVAGCTTVPTSLPVAIGSILSQSELASILPSKDLDGNTLPVGTVATIYYFTGPECPISRAYSPEVARLAARDRTRGVVWVMAFPEEGITAENIRTFQREYSLSLPSFLDTSNALCCDLGVQVIPSVAVVSASGQLIYRGRIDNRYKSLGVSLGPPTIRDLDDVVNAVVAGAPLPPASTPAIGCVLAPCGSARF